MPRFWGIDLGSAIEIDCQVPHIIGAPLTHIGNNVVQSKALDSRGIADGAILADHITKLLGPLFGIGGDGSDGNIVLDGSNNYPSFLPFSGGVYSASRDIACRNLTINTLQSIAAVNSGKNYRITGTGTLTLSGTSQIKAVGVDGTAGASTLGGGGGTSTSIGTVGGGNSGGSGGRGGGVNSAGNPGVPTVSLTGLGGQGGAGADGQTVAHAGGAGGTTAYARSAEMISHVAAAIRLFDVSSALPIAGGTGGGGGGGGSGSASAAGGGGGGGGGAGGVVLIAFDTIDISGWTSGNFSVAGGKGGDGESNINGGGGAGGGGGGGIVIVVCRRIVGGNLTAGSNVLVTSGTGGTTPYNSALAPSGVAGTFTLINLSNPVTTEFGDAIPHSARPIYPAALGTRIRNQF